MHPDRPDRDLAAELEAERVNTEHWRRVARQRTESYEALKHRTVVRAALAAERITRPLAESARTRLRATRARAERAALAAAALGSRRSARVSRSGLEAAGRDLPVPDPDNRTVTIVSVGTPRPECVRAAAERGLMLVVVEPSASESAGRAVQRAFERATTDLVCILAATSEPLDGAWPARLAACIRDDVVAATALLVHPPRAPRTATPHDLLVRESGLDLILVDGVPSVRAIGAGTHPDPTDRATDVGAASAACVMFDRRRVAAAGGFPPADEVDVAAVELCARLRGDGGRIAVAPSVVVLDHRPVASFRELTHPIGDGPWRGAIDRSGPALARAARGAADAAPTFALTVASPSRKVAAQWGDWHLAEALAHSLRRLGHDVIVQTADEADDPRGRSRDVHVVVRGLTAVRRTPGQRHVMWIISHPEAIEDAELDAADLVLVASPTFAAHLRERTGTPVEVLLQATDHRRFRPTTPDPAHRHPITVVAKTRDVARPIVSDALAMGLRPSIYGSGWRDLVDPALIVADHVDNDRLPIVYSSAGVVLNDHWAPMQAWGFVSNRLFDVLACGTPVISDPVSGIVEMFDGGVLEYRSPGELRTLVDQVLGEPDRARRRAEHGRAAVLAKHTFDHRAAELIAAVERITNGP